MQFIVPEGLKPGLVCEKADNTRFATANGLLFASGNRTYIASTNGRILSVLPVECDSPPGKPVGIPSDALNANGKPRTLVVEKGVYATSGKKVEFFELAKEGRFPQLSQIFPSNSPDYYASISIDAELLHTLANAISDNGCVTLLIPPLTKNGTVGAPIPVIGHSDGCDSGIGLIVPLTATSEGTKRPRERLKTIIADLPGAVNFAE